MCMSIPPSVPVCVCVCVCVCVRARARALVPVRISTLDCGGLHMCVCAHARGHACVSECMCVCARTRVLTRLCVQVLRACELVHMLANLLRQLNTLGKHLHVESGETSRLNQCPYLSHKHFPRFSHW